MKKIMGTALLALLAQITFAEPADPDTLGYHVRFVAIDNKDREGFYWLDSTTGRLWEFDDSRIAWEDLGTQDDMEPGPNGTYRLLSSDSRGIYVLNTSTGQGWWFDGSEWEKINKRGSLLDKNAAKLL